MSIYFTLLNLSPASITTLDREPSLPLYRVARYRRRQMPIGQASPTRATPGLQAAAEESSRIRSIAHIREK